MTNAPIPHTLTIHPSEDGELRYTLTCPAGTEPNRACTLYEKCGCEPADPNDSCCDSRPCLNSSTGIHIWLPGPAFLAAPTDRCWPRDADTTCDAVLDLGLPPGVYQVLWTSEGDAVEYLNFEVVTEVSA